VSGIDAVNLDLTSDSKADILKEFVGLLDMDEKSEGILYKTLKRRENLGSTGIGTGIAIPHCSMEEIDDTLVSLGVSGSGVDFESIDGGATHLILLLVTPRNKTKVHIRTLAEIAKLLNDNEFRGRLVAAGSPEDILSQIRQQESLVP